MKFLIFFIALSAIGFVHCADTKQKEDAAKKKSEFLEKIAAECSEELNFDIAQARKLLLGDLSNDSREAKCFMQCFFTKEGFLGKDGKADIKFIVNSLEGTVPLKHYQIQKIVSKCAKFKTDDGCENAFWLLQCFIKGTAATTDENDEL